MASIPIAIADGISGFWRTHKMGQWFLDFFGVHLAMVMSFCSAMGDSIVQHNNGLLISFGYGLLAVPAGILAAVGSNPRLRGMVTAWWKPAKLPENFGSVEVDVIGKK
jgi:hypothetical protein